MASFIQKPVDPFTPDQVAWFHAHSLVACEKTVGNSQKEEVNREGYPWRKIKERPDLNLKVYTSEAKGTPLIIHRAICIFNDIVPEQLLSFTQNIDYRLTWDRNTKSLKEVPISDETELKHGRTYERRCLMLRSATKQVGPISSRDFIDVNMIMTQDDGSIVSAGAGLLPEQTCGHFPVQSDAVRGFNHFWGLHLEKHGVHGKDCKLTYLLHCDLKGWFRPMVINHVAGGFYISFFQDLKAALKNGQGPKIMENIRLSHEERHQRLISLAADMKKAKTQTASSTTTATTSVTTVLTKTTTSITITETETTETESAVATATTTATIAQQPVPSLRH